MSVRTMRVPPVSRPQRSSWSTSDLRKCSCTTSAWCRTSEVLVYYSAATKWLTLNSLTTSNDPPDRITRLRVNAQRFVHHALSNFKTRGQRAIGRYRLIYIGWHTVSLSRLMGSFVLPIMITTKAQRQQKITLMNGADGGGILA